MPNTPGKAVVLPSGKRAVGAGGKALVYNAEGLCPECCEWLDCPDCTGRPPAHIRAVFSGIDLAVCTNDGATSGERGRWIVTPDFDVNTEYILDRYWDFGNDVVVPGLDALRCIYGIKVNSTGTFAVYASEADCLSDTDPFHFVVDHVNVIIGPSWADNTKVSVLLRWDTTSDLPHYPVPLYGFRRTTVDLLANACKTGTTSNEVAEPLGNSLPEGPYLASWHGSVTMEPA